MSKPTSREEALFVDALACPAEQRLSFLATMCADQPRLRARIIALLAAHASPDSLNPPLVTRSALDSPLEKPGDRIGRYKLMKKIGEGGCGVVYLAEQEEPVRRPVALKVIKAGMDTHEVIARFAAERQALALMDHPGIAKVLDAGATDAGRPYFVMELVRGTPITKYSDERNLATGARLNLFMDVCYAVQHAHQKGIIHRDIKPSNILVTDEAEVVQASLLTRNAGILPASSDLPAGSRRSSDTRRKPLPKVIDFGIAKAIEGRLTDATLVTAVDQFIGTPAYMSPEQAGASEGDVDTRSDVYSLGVLLYELLVGRPPFDPQALRQSSREEVRRIIREVEPRKPSAQFSLFGGAVRSTIAATRNADPGKLSLALERDLDWIVMKAIEKDRTRRYESAAAFAGDIARYLTHEPVAARPPSSGYRAAKLIRRNRLAFAAAAAVSLALTAGATISIWQAVRAKRAGKIADAERLKAIDERARAEELLDFMIGDLRAPLRQVGQLSVLESVARKAMAYFAARPPASISNADLARHTKTLLQLGELRVDQARFSDAQEAFAAAYVRAAALAERRPDDRNAHQLRSQAEGWNGQVLRRQGKSDEARDWYLRRRRSVEALAAASPADLQWQRELAEAQHSLASMALERGDFAEAHTSFMSELQALDRLSAAAPSDYELQLQQADVVSMLGTIAERSGDLHEAGRRYADQVERIAAVVRKQPAGTHWQFKLAESSSFHAYLLAITGDTASARQMLAQARVSVESLVAGDKTHRRWATGLLTLSLREAIVARAAGDPQRCGELVATARSGLEELAALEPTSPTFQARLALAWRLAAELRFAAGEPDAATAASRAMELGAKLAGKNSNMTPDRAEYANACVIAGQIAAKHGESRTAREYWERGYELLTPHLQRTREWRVLDPALRLATFLNRRDEAQDFRQRLQQIGYVPLQPWPNS